VSNRAEKINFRSNQTRLDSRFSLFLFAKENHNGQH
jgi:hypothetical protein